MKWENTPLGCLEIFRGKLGRFLCALVQSTQQTASHSIAKAPSCKHGQILHGSQLLKWYIFALEILVGFGGPQPWRCRISSVQYLDGCSLGRASQGTSEEKEREREMKVESLDLSSFSLSRCFRFCPWVSRESLPSDLSNGAFAKNLFPWMLQTPLLVPPVLSAWRSGFQAVKSHWKCIDQNDWRLAHGWIHKIALNPEHSFRHPSCAPRSKNHSLSLSAFHIPHQPTGSSLGK